MRLYNATYLGERHLGDDGQHNLFALGRVRVLAVLVQPGLERGRRVPSNVFSSRPIEVESAIPVGTF